MAVENEPNQGEQSVIPSPEVFRRAILIGIVLRPCFVGPAENATPGEAMAHNARFPKLCLALAEAYRPPGVAQRDESDTGAGPALA